MTGEVGAARKRIDGSSQLSDREVRYAEAQRLMEKYRFVTMKDTGEIYVYDEIEGIYKPEQRLIHEEVQTSLGMDATPRAKADIVSYIQDTNPVDRSEFDTNPDLLHFDNCWYCIICGETFLHSPERLSMSKIATAYDPKARCPTVLRFLGQILKPVDVFHFMQIAGYCLLPNNKYEKMFWFMGGGGNGKGKAAEILQALVGPKNWVAQSLKSLQTDKNAQARLYGKTLNIDHDTEEKIDLSETSALKKIVSGNPFSVRAMYHDYFELVSRTKLIILTNSRPEFSTSNTYADKRRLDLMTFTKTIGENDVDVDLIEKLTTPEELSGFLNLALVGLSFLLREGWARSLSIQQMAQEFDQFGDSVQAYITERCIFDDYTAIIPAQELYLDYVEWCKDHGKTPEAANTFGGVLARQGIDNRLRTIKNVRVHCYFGVRIRGLSAKAAGQQAQL